MKLTAIVPVLNQFPIAKKTVQFLLAGLDNQSDILVLDNGSDIEFDLDFIEPENRDKVKVVRLPEAIGSYPAFREALKYTDAEILAFFHSDLFVYDIDWVLRVRAAFQTKPKLGLVGFIGSNEIDSAGGRGLGTMSNFMGNTTDSWTGSPAEPHGKRVTGYHNAAVVDGCTMIFRRKTLEEIGFREDFPIHHFYDKMMSCQVLEKGWEVAVMGIGCDHISGQTVNQEGKYHEAAKRWCEARGINAPDGNWDLATYKQAERLWLNEYRDAKHLIPIKVS